MNKTLLPGGNRQLKFLREKYELEDKRVLIVGSGSELIAQKLASDAGRQVELIVEDYDSLMNSKLVLEGDQNVFIRIMDFQYTDFSNEEFDLVFCQASISDLRRNKIVKEMKRILKPGGNICIGEIVRLEERVPVFVQDIWDNSELDPLFVNEIEKYYTERKLEIVDRVNLSNSLKNYYSENLNMLGDAAAELDDKEKSYYKKILNKISHESQAYLKQGGDRFIGFEVLILKKV